MIVQPHSKEPISAEDYLAYAVSLYRAAESLAVADKQVEVIPFYLLVGFAIENGLKAYLFHKGHDAEELRRKYGHKLLTMMIQSRDEGLGIGKDMENLIIAMDKPHRRFLFRYPSIPNLVELFKPEYTLFLTNKFLAVVADGIGYRGG
jgi:hypothetical protein